MIRTISLLGGIAVLAIAASASLPAFANGGDFFMSFRKLGPNATPACRSSVGYATQVASPFRARSHRHRADGPDGQSVTIISDNLATTDSGPRKDIDGKKIGDRLRESRLSRDRAGPPRASDDAKAPVQVDASCRRRRRHELMPSRRPAELPRVHS